MSHSISTIMKSNDAVSLLTKKSKRLTSEESDVILYHAEKREIDLVSVIWRELEKSVDGVSLSSRWDFVNIWISHFGDVVDYSFLLGLKGDVPIGIVMLTRETQRPLPIPVVCYHIGLNGEPYKDMVRMIHNTILVRNDARHAFFKALIQSFSSDFDWEEIVFDNYSKDDARALLTLLPHNRYTVSIHDEPTLFFNLEQQRKCGKSVLDLISSENRYKIKRSIKAFGDLTVEWAENEEQAMDILNELIALYNKMWKKKGRRSVFDSTRFTSFHRTLIPILLTQQSVILFRVKSKRYGTLGCLYLFVDNGVAYGYQLGFNDFANTELPINKKRLKIGFIMHTLCMQACLERGLKAYNFGTGIYPYKQELSNDVTSVVTISIKRGAKPYIRERIIRFYNTLNAQKCLPFLLRILQKMFFFV